MEMRQLKYFMAVAKAESYSAAAAELEVAQPTLSIAVRNLEQELGVDQYEVRREGEIRVYDAVDAARVTAVLSAHGVAVAEIYLHGQDLEGYFLELMGGADHV